MLPPGTTQQATNLIFTYTYDNLDRLTTKRMPSAAPVTYLYNTRDLLTFSQDGNQLGANQWFNIPYDTYGRPTKTGIFAGTPANGNTVPTSLATFTPLLVLVLRW